MLRLLRWGGIIVIILIMLAAASAIALMLKANARLERTYNISIKHVEIPTDDESLANGKILGRICAACHSDDFGGAAYVNEPDIIVVNAPNITSGRGGMVEYTEQDWLRVIRHGVKRNGKPALFMPSISFSNMSDEDVGGLIAYLKTIPPVEKEWDEPKVTPLGKLFFSLGAIPAGYFLSAEGIDHKKVGLSPAPRAGINERYGEYLVNMIGCGLCHGKDLRGRKNADDAINTPDITSEGDIGTWSEDEFIQTLRTGFTPKGKKLNNDAMPWLAFRHLQDERLQAIYCYLLSLP